MNQSVASIDPSTIARVYSGKPGCGCGCRGSYYDDARNINRVVKLMNSRAAAGETIRQGEAAGPAIYAVENETRYLWAYAK